MPALDGTGPMGMGPMTGGGRGWCNPYYAGMRPSMMGFPFFRPFGEGGMPYGFGTYALNPYSMGFRGFRCRPFGFGRGLRRR